MIRRVFTSLGLSMLVLAVTLVGQLVAVPIYLSHWGAQLYGEWLALTNLTASLTILNIGVQSYALNRMISFFVNKQLEQGTRILHSALRLYFILCSIAFAVVIGLAAFPNIHILFNIKLLTSSSVRTIILIQGLLVVYTILEGLLMSLLIVAGKLPHRLVYSLVERILLLVAPVAVALLGGKPLFATYVIFGGMLVVGSVQLFDLKINSPYPLGVTNTTWKETFALVKPSINFMGVTIASQLLASGIVLVISTKVGNVAVALYTTTLMMTNFFRTMIYQGLNVLWPEITATAALETSKKSLVHWHRFVIKLVSTGSLLFGMTLIVFGDELYGYWTRNRLDIDQTLNIFLVIYLVCQSPTLVSRIFGLAMNKQDELLKVELVLAIAVIFASLSGISLFDVRGVAAALIASQIIGTIVISRLACKWVGDEGKVYFQAVYLRGLPVILLACVSTIGLALSNMNLESRLGVAAMVVAVLFSAFYFTWLSPIERERFHQLVRSLRLVSINSPESPM